METTTYRELERKFSSGEKSYAQMKKELTEALGQPFRTGSCENKIWPAETVDFVRWRYTKDRDICEVTTKTSDKDRFRDRREVNVCIPATESDHIVELLVDVHGEPVWEYTQDFALYERDGVIMSVYCIDKKHTFVEVEAVSMQRVNKWSEALKPLLGKEYHSSLWDLHVNGVL